MKWKIEKFIETIKDPDMIRIELEKINPNAILHFEDYLKEKIKNLIDSIYNFDQSKNQSEFSIANAKTTESNIKNISMNIYKSDNNSGNIIKYSIYRNLNKE